MTLPSALSWGQLPECQQRQGHHGCFFIQGCLPSQLCIHPNYHRDGRHTSRDSDWWQEKERDRSGSDHSMLTIYIRTIHDTVVSISLKHGGLYFYCLCITVGREMINFKYNKVTGKKYNIWKIARKDFVSVFCRPYIIVFSLHLSHAPTNLET